MRIEYKKSAVENVLSLLQGVDVGAQRYVQGKRLNREQDQRETDSNRSYQLRLSEDARRNAEESRQAQAFPLEQKAREESVRSHTMANDEQQQYAAQQQQDEDYERQIEIDSHRQEQAQAYKRLTGQDVPPEYWGTDAQGHKPGEMGWHWTMYDPKSEVPIKVQVDFNRRASELSTLPPNATRAEKAAALRRDTHKAVVDDAKKSILDEASAHVLPDQPDPKAEPDPSQYVPAETFKKLQKMAEDETASPDKLRKAWDDVQKSHAQELAALEARQLAVEGLDMHAQRIAQQQQDYGDIAGKVDPEAFEAFRTMRHRIGDSKLSGAALHYAVEQAKSLLTPGPKPRGGQNDKTGFNAGNALDKAIASIASTPEYMRATPEQRDAMIQAQASKLMRMAQSLAGGDMPGASASGNHPNTPEAQARAASAVDKERGGSRQQREADIRANPEKYRGRFKSREELEAFLNGG